MSVAGLQDLPLEIFSGLVTDLAAADLPPGASPAQSDCAYILGGVLTRPGLGAGAPGLTGFAGTPKFNYLKTFTDQQEQNRLLFLDSLGNLRQEFPQFTITLLNPGSAMGTPGAYGQSNTLFGREYLAFSDGKFGINLPRQWDTVNYDRVSQCGVGAPPSSAADVSFQLTAITRTSNIISGTTATPHGLVVGGLVNIAGVAADPTLNGQWPVASVPTPTTFTAWGAPGFYAISVIQRIAGTVTVTLPTIPESSVADTIVIGGVNDSGFNGSFTITAINGNQVSWTQAGANAVSYGGTYYTVGFTIPVISMEEQIGATYARVAWPGGGAAAQLPIPGFVTGGTITIAGNSVVGYNASYTVNQIQTTYLGSDGESAPFGDVLIYFNLSFSATGYGGTATASVADSSPAVTGVAGPAGAITAGEHEFSVAFITRQGYITRPSPFGTWAATGGFAVLFTDIPIGPANIVGRLILMTTAQGATFFYNASGDPAITNSAMFIGDNTTTTLTLSIDDTTLASSQDGSTLFSLDELGDSAGVIPYSSRLFWWGERNKVQNFLNLTFDGGIKAAALPLGWNVDISTTAPAVTTSAVWGDALQLTGNGVTGLPVKISQTAYKDYLDQPILLPNTAYSVRVRIQLDPTNIPTQGNVHVHVSSVSLGIDAGLDVLFPALTTTYQEFVGTLMAAIPTIPADLKLAVYIDGNPTNAKKFNVDDIEVFPAKQPYNNTLVRASYVEDPESYSGVTGFLNVQQANGQAVRSCFVLREKLYFVKERSMYTTEDDGQNEPDAWSVTEISNKVGTPSVQGVDVGEEWAVIAARQGLYIFWGPEPVKISQEIQPTWNTINWAAGQTIWVRIDDVNRRILVGAPVNGATSPNTIFVFDYRGLDTAQEIADHWTVRYSSYTGKILAIGNAPKWAPWTMTINAAALVERNDGTSHLFMGNGAGTGKIYDLLDPQQPGSGGVYNDDGAGIPWSYTTYYGPGHQDEQNLRLGSHRKQFGYLTGFCEGTGQMDITAQPLGNTTPIPLLSIQLVNVGAPAAVTNASRSQGITTITCAAGHGLTATDTQVVLSNLNAATMNSTFPLLQILNATQFTVYQPGQPDIPGAGAGGTAGRLLRDFEMTTNFFSERAAYTFSNHGNTANSWFKLQKLVVSMQTDPWSPVRGGN